MATDDASEASDGGGFLNGALSPSKLATIAAKAKLLGKQTVVPMLQKAIRGEVVRILQQNDPDELRSYIDVDYPLVANELPDGYKNALGNVGPEFEDQIIQMVNPETIMMWLDTPEEWMEDGTDEEVIDDIHQVREILQNYPGGQQWLEQQVIDFYGVCNLL